MKDTIGTKRENWVAELCSLPFLRDFVCLRPMYRKGQLLRELSDVLIVFDDLLIAIQVKAAETPSAQQTPERQRQWALKQTTKGVRQARGAISVLRRRSITSFQSIGGELLQPPLLQGRVYGLVVADYPIYNYDGFRVPGYYDAHGQDILCLSSDEFREICNELTTASDMADYIDIRLKQRDRTIFKGSTELDLLAAYVDRRAELVHAWSLGDAIILPEGFWRDYCDSGRRTNRHAIQKNSFAIDTLVEYVANCIDATHPMAHPTAKKEFGSVTCPQSSLMVRQILGSLTRYQRISMVNHLLNKSYLMIALVVR